MSAELIKLSIDNAPNLPGIYKFKQKDEILYIGKAKNLQNRLKSYIQHDLAHRIKLMIFFADSVEYTVTNSESDALLLEAVKIKEHKPKFNILLKDDKSFPYIKISNAIFPQITKYRGKTSSDEIYFGPFASNGYVTQVIKEIQKIFKLRSCNDNYFSTRKRPCLLYQINRCAAPCTNKITKEAYKKLVNQTIEFLSGKTKLLQRTLEKEMHQYSDNMEYEKAAEIRDRIKAINYIQVQTDLKDADTVTIAENAGHFCIQVFFYRAGQNFGNKTYFFSNTIEQTKEEALAHFLSQFYNAFPMPPLIVLNITTDQNIEELLFNLYQIRTKIICKKIESTEQNVYFALNEYIEKSLKTNKILEELKEVFALPDIPRRIEIYDNSHIMGSFSTGAMVVSTNGKLDKKEYRLWNINIANKGDDYQMLREVLIRRLSKITDENKPDLIIIDGGKGHMSVTSKIIKHIPFVCMAKGESRNSGQETFYMRERKPFTLDNTSNIMLYLQMLRNEVHNFVINSYRKKHIKSFTKSSFDQIDGIGKIRKQRLLAYFGSIQNIKAASIEELTTIPSITKKIAEKIKNIP